MITDIDLLDELRLIVTLSGQLAAASKNIKTAISRINCAWNLQNSPIFSLPDRLILHIFEDLQSVAYESPSRTRIEWWRWLRVMSVCRTWWKISTGGPNLWENVHILSKMPDSFLDLVLDRAGARPLAIHFRTCDFRARDIIRHEAFPPYHLGPLSGRTAALAAHKIKSFTTQITDLPFQRETHCLHKLFQTTPYPDLESLDISYNAFHARRFLDPQPSYRPDLAHSDTRATSSFIHSVPTFQLKHLTLRHITGWLPMRLGNLTHFTLFGYADANDLREVVRENPALQKVRLESIKSKKRYRYHPVRPVNLDGQTLELVRCEPGVLDMFSLSPRCSLVIIRTMNMHEGKVKEFQWLPEDTSKIRCLHELEELHFSITKITRKRGWIAAEQKTVGYPTSDSTSVSEPKPHVTFSLTYHYDTTTPPYEVWFKPRHLLPHPLPWKKRGVTRASFDGFHDQFKICDNTVLRALPDLRSLALRRCASDFIIRFPAIPNELPALESLRFEDELSVGELGDTLANALEFRHMQSEPAVLRLGHLIITSGHPSSIITVEQMEKLKEFACSVEVRRAPGYRPVINTTSVR